MAYRVRVLESRPVIIAGTVRHRLRLGLVATPHSRSAGTMLDVGGGMAAEAQ